MRITLVAIAKNEAQGLREWLAYHYQLGFDAITVYDNQSTDATAEILQAAGDVADVTWVPWPDQEGVSPQISAYQDYLEERAAGDDWVAFFDIDEFLVLHAGADLRQHLSQAPEDAGAIGVNWVSFGSSGQCSRDYPHVIETFTYGPKRHHANNYHIKSIVRPSAVRRHHIHRAYLSAGRYYHPNYQPLRFANSRSRGKSFIIEHSVMQLNHYQIKSLEEYEAKTSRGRAGPQVGRTQRIRDNADKIQHSVDRMDAQYHEIDAGMLAGPRAQPLLNLLQTAQWAQTTE